MENVSTKFHDDWMENAACVAKSHEVIPPPMIRKKQPFHNFDDDAAQPSKAMSE